MCHADPQIDRSVLLYDGDLKQKTPSCFHHIILPAGDPAYRSEYMRYIYIYSVRVYLQYVPQEGIYNCNDIYELWIAAFKLYTLIIIIILNIIFF